MRVVVAMSGGVDSSVTAGLLQEAGHEVIGIHMRLHAGAASGGGGACCGLDDSLDARRVADRLNIPFYILNLTEVFEKAVMDNLAQSYRQGFTPNPCVQCNGVLKFSVLLKKALGLGAEALATGHYARITHENGIPHLRCAVDGNKDQTYFLFPIKPEALAKTMFPLGDMTKDQVRDHARRMNLATANKAESMEVCFLPDDDHTRFVRERDPDDPSGEIVDEAGNILGKHDAFYRYTIGQRRGLGLAGGPWYVLSVEAATRRVIVGPAEKLESTGLEARGFSWLRPVTPEESLHVRIRHRGAMIPCTVASQQDTTIKLHFQAPARAVAPGQAAVVYAGDEVVGGGYIRRAVPIAERTEKELA